MLKTYLEFTKDGRTICVPSWDGKGAAIQSCTLTECVNSGEELTIGSVCSCSLEATLMLLDGELNIAAGDTVTVYKQLDNNTPTQVGVFVLERPTRVTANTMKITGFDYVSKLDKDLTAWLAGLKEWPYTLTKFAREVCKACGLDYTETDVPNKDFQVQKFTRTSVTGRQLMRWLGEICCSFCRADRDGNIEFAWYADSGVEITTCGEPYYFQNGLTFEDYTVTPVGAVQLRLADSENGALWPDLTGAENSYIITGNPILNREITEGLGMCLETIHSRLENAVYTPCRVEIPANVKINAGDIVKITDKNGKTITTYVMTKTQSGQKDTLESTGSARRDNSGEVNNRSQRDQAAAMENYASARAEDARGKAQKYTDDLDLALDQLEVLKRLTAQGTDDAIYMDDGKLAIKATAILTGVLDAALVTVKNLVADTITSGVLQSKNKETFYLDLDKGILNMKANEFSVSGKTVDAIAQDKADVAENNAKSYADSAASSAVSAQTQEDIFNKLFDYGNVQGFEIIDGKLYINGEYAEIENLNADRIAAGTISSENGKVKFDLERAEFLTTAEDGSCVVIKNGSVLLLDPNGVPRLVLARDGDGDYRICCIKSSGRVAVGMGVSSDNGMLYAAAAPEQGSGTIGFTPVWRNIDGYTVLCGG